MLQRWWRSILVCATLTALRVSVIDVVLCPLRSLSSVIGEVDSNRQRCRCKAISVALQCEAICSTRGLSTLRSAVSLRPAGARDSSRRLVLRLAVFESLMRSYCGRMGSRLGVV
ncbi:Hypothetical predicted protein [Olea europaea subsp. europaea]|uniref:Uncharacterized protein n=1 Tax=Olea europaea subsp. europaea TaxID=158383 RepID=A0A8S0PY05_OLEEU|nr:Hypothetical predicted protein [Olea europaea subsp. europaea]